MSGSNKESILHIPLDSKLIEFLSKHLKISSDKELDFKAKFTAIIASLEDLNRFISLAGTGIDKHILQKLILTYLSTISIFIKTFIFEITKSNLKDDVLKEVIGYVEILVKTKTEMENLFNMKQDLEDVSSISNTKLIINLDKFNHKLVSILSLITDDKHNLIKQEISKLIQLSDDSLTSEFASFVKPKPIDNHEGIKVYSGENTEEVKIDVVDKKDLVSKISETIEAAIDKKLSFQKQLKEEAKKAVSKEEARDVEVNKQKAVINKVISKKEVSTSAKKEKVVSKTKKVEPKAKPKAKVKVKPKTTVKKATAKKVVKQSSKPKAKPITKKPVIKTKVKEVSKVKKTTKVKPKSKPKTKAKTKVVVKPKTKNKVKPKPKSVVKKKPIAKAKPKKQTKKKK